VAARSNGIHVLKCTRSSCSRGLSGPGSSSSSSSRGEKTGSALGTHGVAAIYFQRRSLSGGSDRPPLAATWLQPTTARRACRPLANRLCRYIGHRAGQDDLLERSRLQALHPLEHRVLDLRQAGSRMRLTPGYELTSNSVAQRPPAWQHAIQFLLIHRLLPPALSASRKLTLPDYAKLSRPPPPTRTTSRRDLFWYTRRGRGYSKGMAKRTGPSILAPARPCPGAPRYPLYLVCLMYFPGTLSLDSPPSAPDIALSCSAFGSTRRSLITERTS